MKNKVVLKKICSMILITAMAVSMAGCGKAVDSEDIEMVVGEGAAGNAVEGTMGDGAEKGNGEAVYANAEAATLVSYEDVFTNRDLSGEYEEAECVKILLNGSSASVGSVETSADSSASGTSDTVQINGSTVTITQEGTYLLTGTLTDGMILVDAEDSAKVQLVLNGVEISNSSNAAIYVRQADKVFVTLAQGTQNTLITGGYTSIDDNNIDACIFSKYDLTVNGTGNLTVNAEEGHGIVSKDDLKVTGGNLTLTAEKHGLSGKDSVCVADGVLTITSGKDGIHSENDEDTEKGYCYLAGGTLTITAEGDGISSGSFLQVDGGSFNLTSGGGSTNNNIATDENGEAVSTKGMKAGGQLVVNDGSFVIDSQDDSLHSNNSLTVNGGTFQVASGDDGLHADENTLVAGGQITITACYEGIEGSSVEISGGTVSLCAEDDGLNAAGGMDGSGFGGRFGGGFGRDNFGGAVSEPGETSGTSASEHKILISGGSLYINAEGDGIDSNGGLYMLGGEVFVFGSTNGGNGALDYDGPGQITGGIIVALGAAQMAMNFDSTSTQGSILLTTSTGQAGTEVVLKDADGTELVSCTAEKIFSSVVISCPELVQGDTYTVSVGSEDTTVTLESLIYGSGSGMGGFGSGRGGMGGFGGDKNGMDGMGGFEGGKGERPELPSGESEERPQMPEGMEPPQDGQMPGESGGMRGEQSRQN